MKELTPARSQESQNPENSAQSTPASISDPPSANQKILHDGKTYTTIKEGLAYVLIPPDAPLSQDPSLAKGEGPAQSVFYNPIQQYNRDLTVVAIRAFGEALVAEKLAKAAELREKRRKKASNKQDKRKGRDQETSAQGSKNKRKLDETEMECAAEQPAAKKTKADRNRYVFNSWQGYALGVPRICAIDVDLRVQDIFQCTEIFLATWQRRLPDSYRCRSVIGGYMLTLNL